MKIMALVVTFLVWPLWYLLVGHFWIHRIREMESLRSVGGIHSECYNIWSEIEVRHIECCESSVESIERKGVEEGCGDQTDDTAKNNPSAT